MGEGSAWLVTWSLLLKTGITLLVFSMVLADNISSILMASGAPIAFASRNATLLILTVAVLLPLCCLESLGILKYTSFAGVFAIFYTIGGMALRYFQGAYAPGGFLSLKIASELRPAFSSVG